MCLQILSDLHLEVLGSYETFNITPTAQNLALLGDIGNLGKPKEREQFFAFLSRQLHQFRRVFFVPGNHEAYGSTWTETITALRQYQSSQASASVEKRGEFILLDCEVYYIEEEDTSILGCSLFSHIPPELSDLVFTRINDFIQTREWTVGAHNAMHKRHLAWLNQQTKLLEDHSGSKYIILTHWSPSTDAQSLDPKHAASPITCGFATDLSMEPCFQAVGLKAWVFGHTHYNCDFLVQRPNGFPLRLVANQYGYYFSQSANFSLGKTIQ